MQLGQGSAQFHFLRGEEDTTFYHSIYDQRFTPSISRFSSVLLRLLGSTAVSSVSSGIVTTWISLWHKMSPISYQYCSQS